MFAMCVLLYYFLLLSFNVVYLRLVACENIHLGVQYEYLCGCYR